jgi:dTDP-glucose 4,6-dehydratase
VLEFARLHGIHRLLFTSSGAIYGRQPPDLTHIPEDYMGAPSTLDTTSVYGQAKRVSEFMCASYGRSFQFDVLIARLFAFVGPLLPLDANYAVGNFIRDAIAGDPIRIAGDGTPYRSYLYAADLTIWLWTILFRGQPALPYNVGSSSSMTIAELAELVIRATDSSAGIEIAGRPISGAPPTRYVPATHRAQHDLGLDAHISVEDGVRRTSNWYRGIQ